MDGWVDGWMDGWMARFTAFLSVDGKDRVVRQRKELKIVAEVCREMIMLLLWLWVLLVQM